MFNNNNDDNNLPLWVIVENDVFLYFMSRCYIEVIKSYCETRRKNHEISCKWVPFCRNIIYEKMTYCIQSLPYYIHFLEKEKKVGEYFPWKVL